MRALTVRQPWAWAIAAGHKTVENRGRLTVPVGELAIHAGRAWSKTGAASPLVRAAFRPWLAQRQLARPIDPAEHNPTFAFGAVVAVATVTDCHRYEPGCCDTPWAETEYRGANDLVVLQPTHIVLANVRQLWVPVPCLGRLSVWTVPSDVEAAITADPGYRGET